MKTLVTKIELDDDLNVQVTTDCDSEENLIGTFSAIAGAMSNVILVKFGAEQATQFAAEGIIKGSLLSAVLGKTYFNGENIVKLYAKRGKTDKEQTEPIKEYKEKKDDD